MHDIARALVYTGPGRAEIEEIALPDLPEGWVQIRARHGALSRGTERLVFEGRVPESEWRRMRAPFQVGEFPFPVRYGYALTGVVEAGPAALLDREVFALHPHQTLAQLPAEAAIPLPDGVPTARAVLAANAETALNAIWDAGPPPGARVLVVGAGLLGCLIAGVLSMESDIAVHITDIVPERASHLGDFNVTFVPPTEVEPVYVHAFHTSSSADGLATALDALVFEGEVIELSWFGAAPVPVPLGGAFHSQRLTIRASQVGAVAAPRRASTSHRVRLEAALGRLADPRFDALITDEITFDALPASIADLLGPGAKGIATRIRY